MRTVRLFLHDVCKPVAAISNGVKPNVDRSAARTKKRQTLTGAFVFVFFVSIFTSLVAHVDLCAMFQQQLHDRDVIVRRRQMQRAAFVRVVLPNNIIRRI
jgi:hypothetical protein